MPGFEYTVGVISCRSRLGVLKRATAHVIVNPLI